jgi:hypothetical protein
VRASKCITEDYLGEVPWFEVREIQEMFRVSRGRFKRLIEDIAASGSEYNLEKRAPMERTVPGTMNDKNILDLLPLLTFLVNGSFISTEQLNNR